MAMPTVQLRGAPLVQGGQQRLAHVALAVSRRAAGPRIAHPKQRCFSSSRDEGGHRVRSGETMCAHVTPRRASKGSSGAQFRQQRAPACAAVATAAAQVPVVTFAGLELFQRDFVAAAVSALGAIAVVKAFDILVSTGMMDRKLTRKGIHILCGPGFVATWFLFSGSSGARFLASIVPALHGLRLLLIGTGVVKNENAVKSISREGDPRELLRGPLFYVVVMCVGTLFFWRTSPVAVVAIAAMCGGDGMADVVGRRFGKSLRLPFNDKKSVAGSLAMFVSTILLSVGLLSLLSSFGLLAFSLGDALPKLAIIAFASTLVEALPISALLDDNISVPLTAGVMVRAGVMLSEDTPVRSHVFKRVNVLVHRVAMFLGRTQAHLLI